MGKIVDVSEALLVLGLSGSVTEEERAIVNDAIMKAEGAVKRYLHYDPVQALRTEYYPRADYGPQSDEGVWEIAGDQAYLRRPATGAGDELQVLRIPIRSSPAIDLRIDYDGRSGAGASAFPLTSLKVEGVDFWPNYDSVDSDDNRMCRDGIIRSFGAWPTTPGSVRIIYTAGYTAEELHGQDSVVDAAPIVDAVIDETVRRVKKTYALMKQTSGWVPGQIKSERLGDYAYTLGDGGGGGAAASLTGSTMDLMPETKEKLQEYTLYGFAM